MQFILDHIVATVVAMTIFLMLVSIKLRTQEASYDAINHYSRTKQELDFIDMLKRDLHGVSEVLTVDEVIGTDTAFVFKAQLQTTDTTKYKIKYRRTKIGERYDPDLGADVPLYQIKRYEEDKSTGVLEYSGGSMITVTEWFIQARNMEGGQITVAEDAGQIYVRFESTSPYYEDENLRRSRWEATFHPPLLRNDLLL